MAGILSLPQNCLQPCELLSFLPASAKYIHRGSSRLYSHRSYKTGQIPQQHFFFSTNFFLLCALVLSGTAPVNMHECAYVLECHTCIMHLQTDALSYLAVSYFFYPLARLHTSSNRNTHAYQTKRCRVQQYNTTMAHTRIVHWASMDPGLSDFRSFFFFSFVRCCRWCSHSLSLHSRCTIQTRSRCDGMAWACPIPVYIHPIHMRVYANTISAVCVGSVCPMRQWMNG